MRYNSVFIEMRRPLFEPAVTHFYHSFVLLYSCRWCRNTGMMEMVSRWIHRFIVAKRVAHRDWLLFLKWRDQRAGNRHGRSIYRNLFGSVSFPLGGENGLINSCNSLVSLCSSTAVWVFSAPDSVMVYGDYPLQRVFHRYHFVLSVITIKIYAVYRLRHGHRHEIDL